MQVIYALQVDNEISAAQASKKLKAHIGRTEDLYYFFIYSLGELANFIQEDIRISEDKYIASGKVNTSLLNNPIIKAIIEDESFQKEIRVRKLQHILDEDITKKNYYKLKDTARYKAYIEGKVHSAEEEKKIAQYMIKKVLLKSSLFKSHLDDHFINWTDDREVIINLVLELLNKLPLKEGIQVSDYMVKLSEEETIGFCESLLKRTLVKEDDLNEMIRPKLKNWDQDRVTSIDMILMRMAIIELIYFETIPVKVSLNEYLDISKKYSTPKSKNFINGVLDKILKDLKDKGQISKTGRGLLEN